MRPDENRRAGARDRLTAQAHAAGADPGAGSVPSRDGTSEHARTGTTLSAETAAQYVSCDRLLLNRSRLETALPEWVYDIVYQLQMRG
ncbi:hypothetical protein [Azospirillum argentinense]|uniref:Uncharacterized protein n=1 Tax=Azospirillum argentinense TaxID=2970906 RepID=A0A5B0KP86_9PROT|nr:hypothetical protein [Azospirillum argentinense]KAA1053188.1 hypothetical protein FH063_003107 [Azospirillum argentinense]